MRYSILCLLMLLTFSLSAQENDPIEQQYQPLYLEYKTKLQELGYEVGRAGNAPWVRGQYILEYTGAGAAGDFAIDLAKLKNAFGNVEVVGECGCGERKLYSIDFGNNPVFGEERGKGGKEQVASTLGKEEVNPNFFLVPELEQVGPHSPFNKLPPGFRVLPSGKKERPVVVAVLDSGIDPTYQSAAETGGMAPLYLWDRANSAADDGCYPSAVYGWDFVNNDNAPLDDNSHGTHVASRIAEQLEANAPEVNYQFMAVKMLDQNGVGNSFQASCAVLFAAEHGADVINASWGFYGERDQTLKRAFRFAQQQKVATMVSAGNHRVNLTNFRHYPTEFALEQFPVRSIFFVSASETGTQLWNRTNWRLTASSTGAEFMASPGVERWGLMPRHFKLPGNRARKSGTSISTPNASALAAYYKHKYPGANPLVLRNDLITEITKQGAPATLNYRGKTLKYMVFDWIRL